MTANGWLQILFFAVAIFAITKPVGLYVLRVYDGTLRIPLALRGVRWRPAPAAAILRRNLLIYGVGGISGAVRRYQGDRHAARPAPSGVTMLKHQLRPAILLTLVLMVITGLLYPGLVTAVAQVLFPRQANGSLLAADGRIIGSELIGQQFARAEYFHSRPSAAGTGYDDTLSAVTNKGPTDLKLADTLIAQAVDSAVKLDGAVKGQVPTDLVTRPASGLDPHISPASALLQVSRVARVRHLESTVVRQLVDRYTERRTFGFLGEPRVNVLFLNLGLDSLAKGR